MDIYGVIGYPIKHSLSPAMHNAAFKKLGIDAEYRLFEIKPEELEDFLLNRKDVVGFNITIPHKVRALEILDKKFPSKRDASISYSNKVSGAINTVKRHEGTLLYLNTDVPGFWESLKKDLNFDSKDTDVFLIGCGGAGRSVITALTFYAGHHARKIYIYENNDKAIVSAREHFTKLSMWETYLKNKIEFIPVRHIEDTIKQCQLLVNASPVGMKEGDTSLIVNKLLHKELSVYDVVYNRETQLVKDAKSVGCKAVGGLGMLLYQGVRAFEFWTGKKAPIDVMKEALDKALKLQGNV